MSTPSHIRAFRDALLGVKPVPITIPGTQPPVVGLPGIRESTRIQYNKHDFQELKRTHEYTFALPEGHLLELSVQLYMNDRDHWRLFAYSVVDGNKSPGMLFSVNLTAEQEDLAAPKLRQTLMLASRSSTKADRILDVDALVMRLQRSGFVITEGRHIELGSFDARKNAFVGTSATAFLRSFVIAAVLKGPYMGNKGYGIAGGGFAADSTGAERRSEPTLKAAQEAVDDNEVFDPLDSTDARQKTLIEIARRQGQPEFRKALIKAYEGQCAVTGCNFEGTLEAAHITPYLGAHTNHVTNGLLLRADIHTLFDLRLIAVDSKTMTVLLHRTLRGTVYGALEGDRLTIPKADKWHPSSIALDDHRKKAGL